MRLATLTKASMLEEAAKYLEEAMTLRQQLGVAVR
jgi:hypothetical protein